MDVLSRLQRVQRLTRLLGVITSPLEEGHTDSNEDESQEELGDREEPQTSNEKFKERTTTSDITLVVEGQDLYVHKSVLAVHSPVFEKMFTTDFKEKHLAKIPLEEKKYTAMVNLLEQIYPGEGFKLMKDNTLQDLLQIADYYEVRQVFRNCKNYIEMMLKTISIEPSTDQILLYLAIVDQYEGYEELHSLRDHLVELASCRNSRQLRKRKNFSLLPAETRSDVLMKRIRRIEEDRSILKRLNDNNLNEK